MKTIYYVATSLDGYIADERGSVDWLMQFADPEESDYEEFMARIGAVVMGSTTYDWLLKHLASGTGAEHAWPYRQPVWVLSHRELPGVPGAEIRFARGDVAAVHAEMEAAAGGRDAWVVGGGDLAGQFLDAGLLDELIVTVAPVTLGAGAPLLPRNRATPAWKLVSARAAGSTFVRLHYEASR